MPNEFWEEHYGQLVGWTVSGVANRAKDPDLFPEGLWGLTLTNGEQKKVAWVLRDPEGNGGGFLEIMSS